MNNVTKLSIADMELSAMWAKLQSMSQNMVTDKEEYRQMQEISDMIDKLRTKMATKLEMEK